MSDADATEGRTDLMTPPIIGVYHDGEICVFPSVEDAEREVEGIDIEIDDFAYDSKGRLLKFEVSGVNVPQSGWGWVDIGWASLRPAEITPTHREQLTETLRNWLAVSCHWNHP